MTSFYMNYFLNFSGFVLTPNIKIIIVYFIDCFIFTALINIDNLKKIEANYNMKIKYEIS